MIKYPLLLRPVTKDYLWGGERLKNEYSFISDSDKIAEAWMLSCHKAGTNVIANGEFAGKRLDEVLSVWNELDDTFPILIKLIDAKDKLSVQVHPNDTYALEREGELGKTEMWYVVDALPNSKLVYGFNRAIDKYEFKKRIENNDLDEVLNYVPVKKGDVFFISAGTLHAIGEGILIAEIQQNSNTTYRVSDYGRLGADGKPRELHIDKALEVTITSPPQKAYGAVGHIISKSFGVERTLAECKCFKVKYLMLQGATELTSAASFISLLVLEGEIEIEYNSGSFKAVKGDSIYIPFNFNTKIYGNAVIIISERGNNNV